VYGNRTLGRGLLRRRLTARSVWFWWCLSELKRFEEIVEIGFVLVHPIAIFR